MRTYRHYVLHGIQQYSDAPRRRGRGALRVECRPSSPPPKAFPSARKRARFPENPAPPPELSSFPCTATTIRGRVEDDDDDDDDGDARDIVVESHKGRPSMKAKPNLPFFRLVSCKVGDSVINTQLANTYYCCSIGLISLSGLRDCCKARYIQQRASKPVVVFDSYRRREATRAKSHDTPHGFFYVLLCK